MDFPFNDQDLPESSDLYHTVLCPKNNNQPVYTVTLQ